jgi:hypothetical protein
MPAHHFTPGVPGQNRTFMIPIRRRLAPRFLLLLILASVLNQPATGIRAEAIAGAFASPLFESLWLQTDGPVAAGIEQRSWLWGPGPGSTKTEPFMSGDRRNRIVQYFDKARMEVNEAVTDVRSPWRVTTGLLVSEMVEGRAQTGDNRFAPLAPAPQSVAGDPGVPQNPRYVDFKPAIAGKAPDRSGQPVTAGLPGHMPPAMPPATNVRVGLFVPETSRNIPDVLLDYLTSIERKYSASSPAGAEPVSWVYLMGFPITEAYWFDLRIDGKTYPALVQLYQRRVLTYVPALSEGWRVQMGNVGQHYFDWRYNKAGAAPGGTGVGPSLAPLLPAEGGFVGIQDGSFTYRGQKIKLKGTNYWLSQAPFVGTWSEWNGPRVQMELEKARQLGVNAVRVGIPYDHRDSFDVVWGDDREKLVVSPWIKNQMTQFLQIAAGYDMKVIFVLFEWYDRYPERGSRDERSNIAYINGIVGAFANDDRVLAWDLHNEPDNYEEWRGGGADGIIEWLGRMAGNVRQLDRRHPITVGVGKYESLWHEGPGGLRMLDYVDFASFHTYDAGTLTAQIAAIKGWTKKPILLEEMGWPTALGGEPPRPNATFDEPTQSFLYESMLRDAGGHDIAGVMQWTLWDYWGGKTHLIPGHERHFGLVREDGTFKPAAAVFKDRYSAVPLPSDTRTEVPLDTSDVPNVRR